MGKGTKRASPGAEEEKNPLEEVELGEEEAKKLEDIRREVQRTELVLERHAQKKLLPVYEKRREVVKEIAKFWPIALMNNALFAYHAQHRSDLLALSYLEDVWVVRDAVEPRCYTIEFRFKENPFFNDKMLRKEFKYVPPPATADDKADEDGITPAMLDFSWERDVVASTIKIDWKDPEKALTKLYPRQTGGEEEDDTEGELGSFFNFFESDKYPTEVGSTIADEVFVEAIDYFLGNVGGDDLDSSSEEESSDDEDAEEIDLEKPRKKKQRV